MPCSRLLVEKNRRRHCPGHILTPPPLDAAWGSSRRSQCCFGRGGHAAYNVARSFRWVVGPLPPAGVGRHWPGHILTPPPSDAAWGHAAYNVLGLSVGCRPAAPVKRGKPQRALGGIGLGTSCHHDHWTPRGGTRPTTKHAVFLKDLEGRASSRPCCPGLFQQPLAPETLPSSVLGTHCFPGVKCPISRPNPCKNLWATALVTTRAPTAGGAPVRQILTGQ